MIDEKTLHALQVLTGLTLNDFAIMKAKHLENGGNNPNHVKIPLELTVLGMKIEFAPFDQVATLCNKKYVVHLRGKR